MLSDLLGRRLILKAVKAIPHGFFMELDGEEFFLPGKLAPKVFQVGDEAELFLYRDSEDRLTGTTEIPLAMVGDIRRLRVKDSASQGYYLDWGLSKDLLLPKSQIKFPIEVGQRVLVMVYFDEKGQNLAATTLFDEHLHRADEHIVEGQLVEVTALRSLDIGLAVGINGEYLGMVYQEDIQEPINPGEQRQAWIKKIRPDGKIDVTLRNPSFKKVLDEASQKLLVALESAHGSLPLHDKSPPEEIRSRLGMSKKDFKRAAGVLYRERLIKITDQGLTKSEN